jgi:hypothetical protein
MPIAVTNLPAGVHRVVLKADTNLSCIPGWPEDSGPYYVDFDAVRVFSR